MTELLILADLIVEWTTKKPDLLERNFVPSYLHLVDAIPKTASEKPQERFLLDAFDPEADFVLSESIGETQ